MLLKNLFRNKKEKIKESNLLAGATDYHSHILPGVDDGARSLQTALEILARNEEAGVSAMWLTPHTMEDYPNRPDRLQEHFARFCEAYKGSITLHLASEYMLDNQFGELLERGELLPIGEGGNHLLVETSYYTPPIYLTQTLQRIKANGYHPLLAHPERYIYMGHDTYRELQEMGVRMQLNIPSLAGVYGPEVRKKALRLLKNDMYAVAGSDTHSLQTIEAINDMRLDKKQADKLKALLSAKI